MALCDATISLMLLSGSIVGLFSRERVRLLLQWTQIEMENGDNPASTTIVMVDLAHLGYLSESKVYTPISRYS